MTMFTSQSDCIRGSGPEYFSDVCTPLSAIPGRSGLRAAERGDLLVPTNKSKIGSRSFKVAAPTVWNSLPQHLHLSTISRQLFRCGFEDPPIPGSLQTDTYL